MIIWGGIDGGILNTGGQYDPVTDSWITTSTNGNMPNGRGYFTAIWTGNEMLIWGGYDGIQHTNSLGIYNPYVTDVIFQDGFDRP